MWRGHGLSGLCTYATEYLSVCCIFSSCRSCVHILYSAVHNLGSPTCHVLVLGSGISLQLQAPHVSGRIRYAHIISVVLAVVLPLPGPLIQLKDGYISVTITLICLHSTQSRHYFLHLHPSRQCHNRHHFMSAGAYSLDHL